MTSERATEIIATAQSQAIGTPWSDQLKHVMTQQERLEVMAVWDTMPGYTCFVDALLRIKNTHDAPVLAFHAGSNSLNPHL